MSGFNYGEEPPTSTCPYCKTTGCGAGFCDVGVGYVQVTGYRCLNCGAHQMGQEAFKPNTFFEYRDEITETEKRLGWYKE